MAWPPPWLRVPPGGVLNQSIRSRAALLARCAAYLSFVLNKYITSQNIRQTSARSINSGRCSPLCLQPTQTGDAQALVSSSSGLFTPLLEFFQQRGPHKVSDANEFMPRCALNFDEHGVRYAGLDRDAVGSCKYFTALALSKGIGLRFSGHRPSISPRGFRRKCPFFGQRTPSKN